MCEVGRLPPALASQKEGITSRAAQSGKRTESSSYLTLIVMESVQYATVPTAKYNLSALGNVQVRSDRQLTLQPTASKRGDIVPLQTDGSQLSAALALRRINTKKTSKGVVSVRPVFDERDQLAAAQYKQRFYADRNGRKDKQSFSVGDKVLLSIKSFPNDLVTSLPSGRKLLLRFIGSHTVVKTVGEVNCNLDLPTHCACTPYSMWA